MKHIHKFTVLTASLIAIGHLACSDLAMASPQLRLVQELPKSETSRGIAAAGDYIFSGVSRMKDGESHHLDIFQVGDLAFKAKLNLPHNVMQILPRSETSVLVLGVSSTPSWQSYTSEVSWKTGKFVVRTTSIPVEVIPERMDAGAEKIFFAEPGSAGVYFWKGSTLNRLKGDISGPGAMAPSGHNLWILSRGSLFNLGDERISIGDLSSNTVRYSSISPEDTRGLVDLKSTVDGKFIIGSNYWKQKVAVFNPNTQEKMGELILDHSPTVSAVYGSCAATIDSNLKTIEIVKVLDDGSIVRLATLDLNGAGDRLKSPNALFFNGNHKQIIVKSAYPCPSCTVTQSSVFAFEDSEATWWSDCK